MFNRIIVSNFIYTFNELYYEKIKKAIIDARIYLAYVDNKKDKGIQNKLYDKYLGYKHAVYTKKRIGDESVIKITVGESNIDEKLVEEFFDKYEIDDYYHDSKEIHIGESNATTMTINKMNLSEDVIFKRAIDIDEHLCNKEKQIFRESYVTNKQRFFIIPFLGRTRDKIVYPIVRLTLYNTGIISVQVIIEYEIGSIPEVSEESIYLNMDEAKFYDVKVMYKNIEDYFQTHTKKKITDDDIKKYYKDLLEKITQVEIKTEDNFKYPINFLGNYERDAKGTFLQKLVSTKQEKLITFLNNMNSCALKLATDEYVENYLNDKIIFDKKSLKFYADTIGALILCSDYLIFDIAVKNLKEDEKILKENKIYEEHLRKEVNVQFYFTLFDMIEYYDISILKKFLAQKLLLELSEEKSQEYKTLNKMKKDLAFLKLKFDEELLFEHDGSMKDLYILAQEKNNTTNIIQKSENIINDIYENLKIESDAKEMQRNKILVFFSSMLSVILSFYGIRIIFMEIVARLDIPIISVHPFRFAVGVWGVLSLIMLIVSARYLIDDKCEKRILMKIKRMWRRV